MQKHINELQKAINNYEGHMVHVQGIKLTLADMGMLLMCLKTGTKCHFPSGEMRAYLAKIGY